MFISLSIFCVSLACWCAYIWWISITNQSTYVTDAITHHDGFSCWNKQRIVWFIDSDRRRWILIQLLTCIVWADFSSRIVWCCVSCGFIFALLKELWPRVVQRVLRTLFNNSSSSIVFPQQLPLLKQVHLPTLDKPFSAMICLLVRFILFSLYLSLSLSISLYLVQWIKDCF